MTEAFANSGALWIIAFIVGILSLLVMGLMVVVFMHHFFSDRARKRNRERFSKAMEFLLPAIVSSEYDLLNVVGKARRRFGDRAVGLVLRRARVNLRGDAGLRLSTAMEDAGLVDKLIKESRSRQEWKRINAVRALAECGGRIAEDRLSEATRDKSSLVRRFARDGLIRQNHPEALKTATESFLQDLAEDDSWHHAFYARIAAVAPEELIRMLENGQVREEERQLAIEALADAGSTEALPMARAGSESESVELRATCTRALGKIGGPDELEPLRNRLGDDEWFVCSAAARSLETLLAAHREQVSEAAIKHTAVALSRHLLDPKWWVRANSARALGQCGPAGKQMLFRTAEGTDRYARDAALGALAMAHLSPDEQAKLNEIMAAALAEREAIAEAQEAVA